MNPSTCILQKTDRGRAEIEAGRSLRGPIRTALILVNGRSSVAALCDQLGPATAALLDMLRSAGYVEERVPMPVPVPAAAREPAVRPPPAPPALPPSTAASQRLPTLKRQAVTLLERHFGPDAPLVASALIAATTMEEWTQALGPVEKKLAIYAGKSHAARMLAPLREGTPHVAD